MFRSTFAVGIAALMGTCGCSQPAAINHRANNALCSTLAGPGDCGCTAGTGGASCSGPEFTCTSDTDCTQGINGRCIHSGAGAGCGCTYDQCSNDNDCSAHDCRNTPSEPRCVYSRSVKRWQCACIPIPV